MVWQLDRQESILLHSGQLYSGNNSGSHLQSPAIKSIDRHKYFLSHLEIVGKRRNKGNLYQNLIKTR